MNMNLVFNVIKSVGAKALLKVRKVSPEIAIGAGIVFGAGAIITACMASRKVDKEVIEPLHEQLNDVEERLKTVDEEVNDEQLKKEAKKDICHDALVAYKDAAVGFCKLYWKPAAFAIGSAACTLGGFGIMKNRYITTAAALNGVTEAFRSYRNYVRNELGYGEEGEKAILAKARHEKGFKVIDENGEIATHEGNGLVMTRGSKSPYEYDFNRFTSVMWEPDPIVNQAMLQTEQDYANDLLKINGYVFLNDVLERIGMDKTSVGQRLGWVIDRGDKTIDFGYFDAFMRDMAVDTDICRKNIRLNFNCDGDIIADVDRLELEKRKKMGKW